MNYIVRQARKNDEPFLWQMLYYAAHMDEEEQRSIEDAKNNSDLQKYVRNWGHEMDIGCIALDPQSEQPIGAAWIRLFPIEEQTINDGYDAAPELAIAVLPAYLGKGVGTQLLSHLFDAAQSHYTSIVLSVRASNPAQRLYERMGFVVTGRTINRVGTESLMMRKWLDGSLCISRSRKGCKPS